MVQKKFVPYTTFNIEAIKLPKSAFLVYWTLCKYRDNKTGTAFVSPAVVGLCQRQLRRILKLLKSQGLIAYLYAGRYLVNVGTGKDSRRVRATFWGELQRMGVLRFKTSLALIYGPKGGYSAEGLRETIGCRKAEACRLLRELKTMTPAIWAEAKIPGSRMSPPLPSFQPKTGSQVSRLSTGVEKKENPSNREEFFAVSKYKEFLLSEGDVDRAILLYSQSRMSLEFGRYGNMPLADGVLFAFLEAKDKAKVFGGYFWTALRRNLLTGYCRLDAWRQRTERRATNLALEAMAAEKRAKEEKELSRARAVEEKAKEMFPGYAEAPMFLLEPRRVPRLNPERERMYKAAEAALGVTPNTFFLDTRRVTRDIHHPISIKENTLCQ